MDSILLESLVSLLFTCICSHGSRTNCKELPLLCFNVGSFLRIRDYQWIHTEYSMKWKQKGIPHKQINKYWNNKNWSDNITAIIQCNVAVQINVNWVYKCRRQPKSPRPHDCWVIPLHLCQKSWDSQNI